MSKNPNEKKVRYVIVINLVGLHDTIYTCRSSWPNQTWDLDPNCWWDKEGDVDCDPRKEKEKEIIDGCIKLIYKDKVEASLAMEALKLYRDHLKKHM